jgi:hypothetical protein
MGLFLRLHDVPRPIDFQMSNILLHNLASFGNFADTLIDPTTSEAPPEERHCSIIADSESPRRMR